MTLVSYAPGARADLMSATEWYLEKSAASALSFAQRFDEGISRILANPLQFAKVHKDFRRCPVKKFPYSIIFAYQSDLSLVTVVAVAHAKRDDRYWKIRN